MADDLVSKAKNLRKNSTDAENPLWWFLKSKQIEGLKFRRQEPIGKYIADFVCYETRVVIEVDGGQHAEQASYDARRDSWLKRQGLRVLRFWNIDVLENTEGVLEVIRQTCFSPSPNPSRRGRGMTSGRGRGKRLRRGRGRGLL